MYSVSAAYARKNFSEVVDEAVTQAVFIERRGHRAAVVVSPERYEEMLEADPGCHCRAPEFTDCLGERSEGEFPQAGVLPCLDAALTPGTPPMACIDFLGAPPG